MYKTRSMVESFEELPCRFDECRRALNQWAALSDAPADHDVGPAQRRVTHCKVPGNRQSSPVSGELHLHATRLVFAKSVWIEDGRVFMSTPPFLRAIFEKRGYSGPPLM